MTSLIGEVQCIDMLSVSAYEQEKVERMSSQDAYMFPFIGSAFLLGLYLVFKFVPKEYVNMV